MILLKTQPGTLPYEAIECFRSVFTNRIEQTGNDHPTFDASGKGIKITLEIFSNAVQLSALHAGWCVIINARSKKDPTCKDTLFLLSYGRGKDFPPFDYRSFRRFYEMAWPDLPDMISLPSGEIPEIGFREILLISDEERWNPDSPYMIALFKRIIESVSRF